MHTPVIPISITRSHLYVIEGKIYATLGTSHKNLQMGSRYLPLTKTAMKSTSDKFPMTGSHGRWPSIRNRIVIPGVPNISELRTEVSRTYQPKGIILCGITTFIPTASQNAFAELTDTVCLAINKRRREIKRWWQLGRYLLIGKVELGWSGGILEGSFRWRSYRGFYTVPTEVRV